MISRQDTITGRLTFALDWNGSVPLYLQIQYHFVHWISSGRFRPREVLPSVRELASHLGVSSATIQRSYHELQRQGLVRGHPGKGVLVTDLLESMLKDHASTTERHKLLGQVMVPAIDRARALGLTLEDVQQVVAAIWRAHPSPSRIIFVGSTPDAVTKYTLLLEEHAAPLGVEVSGVLLAELRKDPTWLARFEPVQYLVTVISTFGEVREAGTRLGKSVFGLVVELTKRSQKELLEIPEGAVTGLIAEPWNIHPARSLIKILRGEDAIDLWADTDERDAVMKVLEGADVVIHTFGAKRLLTDDGRNRKHIELEWVPNEASMDRLRSLLSGTMTAPAGRGVAGGV